MSPELTGGGDPFTEYGSNAAYYIQPLVMEQLFDLQLLPGEKRFGLRPNLGTKWSFPDDKSLVVELNKDAKLHNGESFTAEHVKYAFDSLAHAEKPGRRGLNVTPLGECEIVDQYTVRWRMPVASVTLLESVAGQGGLMMAALARKTANADAFERKPLGSGPYKVVDWARDGIVQLEAWREYRGGVVTPQKLTIRTVPDPSTRVLELLSGNAHISQAIPIEAIPSIEADPNLEVVGLKGTQVLAYNINLFKPPFRDKRVRQAMNYAVDRDAVVKTILSGRGAPLPGPLWPGYLGYRDDVKPYPYDPDKARALLTEAGLPSGFTFTWTVTQGLYSKDIEIAQAVASQLGKVGIKAVVQPVERARLLAERNVGNYDVVELVWPMGYFAETLLRYHNEVSYPDDKLVPQWGPVPAELAEVRSLTQEARKVRSLEQMEELHSRVNRVMHDEAFWLFVHTADDLIGVRKEIRWRPYPTGRQYSPWYDYWASMGQPIPTEQIISPTGTS